MKKMAIRFLCICWLLPGCANDIDGDVPGTPDVPADRVEASEFCVVLAGIVCSADRNCCGIPAPDPAGEGTDCVTVQIDACAEVAEPILLDPRVGYSPELGARYLVDLDAKADGCWTEPMTFDDFMGVFEGTGSAGADCTPREVASNVLRLSQLSCQRGLTCHLYLRSDGSPMGICETREDTACSHAFDCGPSERCNLPSDWVPGRWGQCQPLRANGWECSGDLGCASQHCDRSGTCSSPTLARYCASAYSDLVLEDDPVGYWRLSDGFGGSVTTASGEGESPPGIYEGAPTPMTEGALAAEEDGAVRLDGDGDHMVVAPYDALDTRDAITLECWFRADDIEGVRPILEFEDAEGNIGPHIWNYDRGDRIFVNLIDVEGASHAIMSEPGTVVAGEWYHVAATYDGAVGRLHLNGEVVGETTGGFSLRTAGALAVGRAVRGEADVFFYKGAIDEVAVYDHALSRATIRRHHRIGSTGPEAVTFPLFRWLR